MDSFRSLRQSSDDCHRNSSPGLSLNDQVESRRATHSSEALDCRSEPNPQRGSGVYLRCGITPFRSVEGRDHQEARRDSGAEEDQHGCYWERMEQRMEQRASGIKALTERALLPEANCQAPHASGKNTPKLP